MPKIVKKSIFKPVNVESKDKCEGKEPHISINNQVNVTVEQEKEDGCTGCFKALFSAMKR